ncbi:hypothetical protein M406DRAFT_262923, partial [Cryphonectria parasitica EP155]
VLLGAVMMRVGAKIKDEDFQYLRELVPRIVSHDGYTSPLADLGFRGPGKAQFLAALDNYKPGVPRSLSDPSCFHCGKIEQDTGKAPVLCSQCKGAWYCDKDCQRAHWRAHRSTCRGLDKPRFLANV